MNSHRVSHQRASRILSSVPARSSLLIALVTLTSAVTFASTPQGYFEKTFQVSGPVDLEVLTRSGDITVRTGPSGSVFIRGKIYVGDHWLFGQRKGDVSEMEQHPPLRQEGKSIHIDYVNVREIWVNYEITVTAETTMLTRSGSRDQIMKGTCEDVGRENGVGVI